MNPAAVLRFPSSVKRDPAIEIWMRDGSDVDTAALGKLIERAYVDRKRRLNTQR
jgi:hypothetical protein